MLVDKLRKPNAAVHVCATSSEESESDPIDDECNKPIILWQSGPYALASPRSIALLFLIMLVSSVGLSTAISDPVEVRALQAIKRSIGDGFNRLSNWEGDDPCGSNWTGVTCGSFNGTQHVTELRLLNMNFTGTLAPDLGNLTHLVIMDFMWNNITGSIPREIGSLSNLTLLLLNGNKLGGILAPELGNLSNVTRFQIDENNISGPIPSTFQYLPKVKHLHMNNNSLTGTIPRELGRLQRVAHILFDNNNLSGELPPELSNISTLGILQLDNNHFNGSIPADYSNMVNLTKLSLRNCNLTGSIPDLSTMISLRYLDLSQNQLTGQLPSNLSQTVTTIDLSYNQLSGDLPSAYYGLRGLELLFLQNNSLNGTYTAGLITHNEFTKADSVLIMDFQNNDFTGFTSGAYLAIPNITLRFAGNPVCTNSIAPPNLCVEVNGILTNETPPAFTPLVISVPCLASACDASRNQELNYALFAFNICLCVYPLTVHYRLKSPSFAIYQPYESAFQSYLSTSTKLFDYQVNASVFVWEPGPRLDMIIKLFPIINTREFNDSDVSRLYNQFATWDFPDNKTFGPYELIAFDILSPYNDTLAAGSSNGLSGGAIAGIVIGAAAITAIAVGAIMLLIIKRMYHHPSARRRTALHSKRIKINGVKDFTFAEMAKATNNFDNSRQIGQGGYGKVYKAVLENGVEVAIKRALEGSLQGAKEFSTELELLSRIHHRNLVSLIGFCDDQNEQMLVYEYMVNGTLREHLNFGSKTPLNFATRVQIALGAAKGILYLHTEADPPIFHRDIKASNILLDNKLRAKVADFGLSKLAIPAILEGDVGAGVSTVVKGTPGYLDPEYFLTHQLTDKSDVYSFGVVLLELITGQQPISRGKNLVREVNLAYDAGMALSIVDPRMGHYPSECLQPFLWLAIACCKDDTVARPSMAEVVRELEAIWRLMPVQDTMVSFETSVETNASRAKDQVDLSSNSPFLSSDYDGTNLVSGYTPSVTPR